ncbi:hypothetical protein CsSME_00008724 [Camellia sinensis var. sinensis]
MTDTLVILRKIHGLAVEESVAMFIHVLKGFKNRAIQERFQHSGETANNKSKCATSSLTVKNEIPTIQGTACICENIPSYRPYYMQRPILDANTVTHKTSWQLLISTCVLRLYHLDGKAGNIMLLIRAILIERVTSLHTRATVSTKKIFGEV